MNFLDTLKSKLLKLLKFISISNFAKPTPVAKPVSEQRNPSSLPMRFLMTASEISDTFKNIKIIKEIKKVCKKITIENCTSGYVIDACVLIDCDDEKILCNVLKTMPKRNFYISSEIENEFLKSQKYCKKSGKNVKRSLEDLNNLIKKLQNSGLKIYSIDITNEMKSDSNELFREYNRFHKRIDGRRIFHYPDNIHLNLAHFYLESQP